MNRHFLFKVLYGKNRYFLIILFFSTIQFNLVFSQSSKIELWKMDAIGAIWNDSTNTVAYGKKDENGFYKIYLADSLGENEQQLQFAGWSANQHQWAEEWYPSGEYLICYIEKADYQPEVGHTRTSDDAIPGYGAYTDIWIVKRDGSQAWQLTNFPNNYDHGVIHGAISKDGSLFAWSERVGAPVFFDMNLSAGAYVLKVADLTISSTPQFTNIRTYNPGGVAAANELESFSNDNNEVFFYSTFESKNILATPIYKINLTSSLVTKLTNESFSQAPTLSPTGNKIVYMTGRECDIFPFEIQGADWWQMNTNGSNQQRITRMNVANDSQSVNHYRLAGSISFINDSTFYGGVMSQPLGLTGYTAKVTIFSSIGIDQEPDFFVFPNPTNGNVSIHLYNIKEAQLVQVCTVFGDVIYEDYFSEVTTLDMSTFANGIYFIKLKSDSKISAKILKID